MPLPNDASQGLVTARDPSTLKPGEAQTLVGREFRVGSPHSYKLNGRTDTGASTASAPVRGIHRLQYDGGTNVIAAVVNGAVYESAESTAPNFAASGLSGLDASAIPSFCGFQNRWILTGLGANYLREDGLPPSGGSGHWRPLGLRRPTTPATFLASASPGVTSRADDDTGTFLTPERASDSDIETFTTGTAGQTHIFKFTIQLMAPNRRLYFDHLVRGIDNTGFGPDNPKFDVVDIGGEGPAQVLVEYSFNGGTTYTTLRDGAHFGRTSESVEVGNGVDFNVTPLWVRVTVTSGVYELYDLRVSSGGGTQYTSQGNPVEYRFTEYYIDSDGVEQESNASPATVITSAEIDLQYGVTLTLPSLVNTHAAKYIIYRSVDSPGGGYPNLYRIGQANIGDTTFVDTFDPPPNQTPDTNILATLTVSFPTGETFTYEPNGAPPEASLAVAFSGAVVYVPVTERNRIFYSLASTILPYAFEKVPEFQYLDFQSQSNDAVITVAVTNGGRTLLVFFNSYTMLVNYLPQASDGVFDNRVKEYVSNTRGCVARLGRCEFTLPTGMTLTAAVDALGVWATNGVNSMAEWSNDLDWAALMADVDLTTAQLVDNPEKRRLELLYVSGGQRRELHFFYGRLKTDGDGKQAPLISGPHPMGVGARHYTEIDTNKVGFSGASASTGKIYLEGGSSDAAQGGAFTSLVKTGDLYPTGLSGAHLIEWGTLKFTGDIPKTFTVTITTFRDEGHSRTITKTFNSGNQKRIYVHAYADRHNVQIDDTSATAAPGFVGYEFTVRGAGEGRDT